VKNSILLPGVVIAGGCSIEDSILGHGVSVGAGATIQSVSVIGDGVVIPAGATIEAEKLVR
jgi:ADP-glucose pyrophosphorylase